MLSYIILFKLLLFAFKSCFKFCELFKYWRVVVFLIRLSRAALSVYFVVVVVVVTVGNILLLVIGVTGFVKLCSCCFLLL